jgi:putative endonuclease
LANTAYGRWGEDLVSRWYEHQGYEVIARNWRCPVGEIDVIAARPGEIVVCEVKTRATDRFGGGAAAVTFVKQQRLRRLAAMWLEENPQRAVAVRFDVGLVTGVRVEVLEAAF